MQLIRVQKLIFIFLCFLFCITFLQCGDRNTYDSFLSNGDETYFSGGNFTMTFPSGWHIVVSEENQEVSASCSSPTWHHVSVSYDDRNKPVTVIEAMVEDQASWDSLVMEKPGLDSFFRIMDSTIIGADSQFAVVGEYMALRIVTKEMPLGSDMEQTSIKYRFIIGTWDYSIYCSSSSSDFSSYLETFEKICSSFKRGFAITEEE